ncbi:hypothetical protein JCM19235_4066 [Vibrio maritimus]|uniref:Uncharacterized protein n=1 Tax=Vibrio maritimus TaxID=990268 RepID=A0A090RX51_9VIBR|nr:hypothetical protein JCM19235_4066 [Vibrio maritimus]
MIFFFFARLIAGVIAYSKMHDVASLCLLSLLAKRKNGANWHRSIYRIKTR